MIRNDDLPAKHEWKNALRESIGSVRRALRRILVGKAISAHVETMEQEGRGGEVPYAGHPDQLFGHTTYSQHGEDLLFASIFHLLGIKFPSYIDIGAHHPRNISNTALLYSRGSRGINVEANPYLYKKFLEDRPSDVNLNVGVSDKEGVLAFYMIDDFSGRNSFSKSVAEEFVRQYPAFSIREVRPIPVTTIHAILDRYANGKCPSLLTIDVEGLDYSILNSMDLQKYRPAVICAEVVFAGSDNAGKNIVELLRRNNYYVHAITPGNVIFVDEMHRKVLQPWD